MANLDTQDQPPAGRIVLACKDECALPDDGRRHEIIEGDLAHVRERDLGEVHVAPVDVILENTSILWG